MSADIIEQLEQVRASGRTNMVDRVGVQRAADKMGLHHLEDHLEEIDYGEYATLLQRLGKKRSSA